MDCVKDHETDLTSQSMKVSNPSFLQNSTPSINWALSLSLKQYDDLSNILLTVMTPILLLLGTFGNVMTILVMKRLSKTLGNRLGDFSMFVYFPSLAVCDQIVLTVGLLRKWLKAILFFDVRNIHPIICKLHKFVVYAGSRTASWILVAVTSQRVLTVLWPLRQRQKRTKFRAIVTVAVILVACCAADTGVLLLFTLQEVNNGTTKCRAVPSTPGMAYYASNVYPVIRIISGSLLPLLIIILNNIILVYKTRQSSKALCIHHGVHTKEHSDAKKSNSFIWTLIVTSVAFFVLTTPITIDFFIQKYKSKGVLQLVDTVLDLLFYSHSTFNFYLYVLAGRTFRHAVIRQLCVEHSPKSLTSMQLEKRPDCVDFTQSRSLRTFLRN